MGKMQSMESAAVADAKTEQQGNKKILPLGKGLAMEPAASGDGKSKQQREKSFSSPRRRRSTMEQKQLASSFGCYICKGPHLHRNCPSVK